MTDHPVSRKGFLGLGAALGGALGVPASGWAAAPAHARTPQQPTATGTGGPLLDGSRFPIGVFWP
ncbi:hypothetical protein, partial [Desertihabitans aurantiacus]|uniref:hypothetical protein n=1 Tax=Desertihabitans aurantiacus TaxID=2282477 RepID=UPI0018E5A710